MSSTHCVKVFSKEGVLLYEIGSEGSGDGLLRNPNGLAIDNNNLIICVSGNHRQQVFTLYGSFLNTVKEDINETS